MGNEIVQKIRSSRNLEYILIAVCTVLAMFSGFLTVISLSGVWFVLYRHGKGKAGFLLAALAVSLLLLSLGPVPQDNLAVESDSAGMIFLELGTWGTLFGLTALWIYGPFKGPSGKLIAAAIGTLLMGGFAFFLGLDSLDPVLRVLIKGFADSVGLAADLVPDLTLVKTAVLAVMPLSMLVLAGLNWMLGSLLVRRNRVNMSIRSVFLPVPMVWAFIASIVGPLLAWRLALPWQGSAVILMISLMIMFLYFIQGYAILQFMIAVRKADRFGRALPLLLVMLMVLVPVFNVLIFIGLAFFGVSETWLPWRKKSPKPDEKETYPS